MPTIQFDDQVNRNPIRKAQETGIIGLLIRLKLAKSARSANLIMAVFVLIGMSISIYLILQALGPAPVPNIPPTTN